MDKILLGGVMSLTYSPCKFSQVSRHLGQIMVYLSRQRFISFFPPSDLWDVSFPQVFYKKWHVFFALRRVFPTHRLRGKQEKVSTDTIVRMYACRDSVPVIIIIIVIIKIILWSLFASEAVAIESVSQNQWVCLAPQRQMKTYASPKLHRIHFLEALHKRAGKSAPLAYICLLPPRLLL